MANSHILTSSAIIISHENAHYCVPRYRPVLAFQMVPQAWNFWNCPKIMKPKETLLRLFLTILNSVNHLLMVISCTHFCCYFLTFMIYRSLGSLTELTHPTNISDFSRPTWLFSDSSFHHEKTDSRFHPKRTHSSIQVLFIRSCYFWAWGMKNGR